MLSKSRYNYVYDRARRYSCKIIKNKKNGNHYSLLWLHAAYGDDGLLFFMLINFNDEALICTLLNEEQQPEQRVSHVTAKNMRKKIENQNLLHLFGKSFEEEDNVKRDEFKISTSSL
ncbi:hypothetical protein V1478_009114 [Vespula squamosa]|uniref:Uncharacterized protein n=1 Tax=Vespula squamosa TaxID=30214 RepID=A0ABD2ANQ2_VESSQ